MAIMSEDFKDVIERISGMCGKVESVLSLCMDGFMRHKARSIDEAKKICQTVHDEENEMINILSNKALKPDMNKDLIKSLMAVVGHIEMATNGLDNILQQVRVKVNEKLLFTDKAVNEICHLFKETQGMLKAAGDTILTRNEVLMKYIMDKYANLNQTIDSYSEEHEKRLIQGLCQPLSSSSYLSITDSLTKVVWHTKQAVDRFFMSR